MTDLWCLFFKYVKPELGDFRTLHFYKADEIYRQAQPAKEKLKRRLGEKLAAWNTQPGRDGRGQG